MTYEQAIAYLDALVDHERLGFRRHMAETVSLDTMRALSVLLGEPHLGLQAVHIAGSKGKGSVAAMLDAILRAAGHRTGLYTSPHLVSPRERIRIDGQPIPEGELAELVSLVRPAIEEIRSGGQLNPPTFFEAYTAMAFLAFARHRVDVAILETGLGGRLDATNIVTPRVCAITTICLEHQDILGDTIAAIAGEKAGIIKPAVPLVLAPQAPEAREVIIARANAMGSPFYLAPQAEILHRPCMGPDDQPQPQTVRIAGRPHSFSLALLGDHQAANAAVAVEIARILADAGLAIQPDHIAAGLARVRWPGRLDVVGKHPRIVLDCAHTPTAAQALCNSLQAYFRYSGLWMVIGMSEDKDVAGFARALSPLHPRTLLCRARLPRALTPEDLIARSDGTWNEAAVFETVNDALEFALSQAGPDDMICVAGSAYVVGEAMQYLGVQPW